MRKQKRKQAKKPSSDSDSDTELNSEDQQKKQIKSHTNESKNKKSDKSPFSFDSDFNIEVKDGINDLAMLPRELIESELIERGFQPDMTKALDTKFLVNTLRGGKFIPKEDDVQDDRPYYHSYSFELSQTQAPIFDDTSEEILKKRKVEEDKRIEKEKQEEEEMLENFQNINADDFKKDHAKNAPVASKTGYSLNLNFNQPFFIQNRRRHINYSLSINLQNYGVDIEKILDGTPENDNLIKNMEADYSKHYTVEDIIFRNLILNSTADEDDDEDGDEDD